MTALEALADDTEMVLVSYHSQPHLEQLLPLLPPGAVAVVDNSPGAEPLVDLVAARPGARLLTGPGGFGGAVNLAAATSTATYLLLVNPDSRPDPGVLAELVAELRADPSLAGAGPLTRGPDGRIEIGVAGWTPGLRRAVVHALGLHLRHPHAGLVARPAEGDQIDVDWVSGACLAIPRELFLTLGGFDARYHVYSEDMAYGVLARSRGHRQLLRTDLVVPHEGGGSGAPKTWNAWLKGQALAAWLSDHRPAGVAAATRAVLALATLARVPLYLATGRRALAREGLSYVRGLAEGRRADPRERSARRRG